MLNLNQARTWHKAWNKQKNNTLVSPRLPRYVSPALQVGQTSRTTHVDKLTAVSTLRCQPTSEEMTATTKNKQPLSLYFPCKRLQPSLIWHFVLTKGAHHQSSNLCFTPGALPCHQGYTMEHRGQSLPLIRWGLSRRNTSTPIWPFFLPFFLKGAPDCCFHVNTGEAASQVHTFSTVLQRQHKHTKICFLLNIHNS